MLRLSKKADYALIAMKHLAMRPDSASASAREIAEQYDIPIELMAKVLQRLARRGLLTSHQGTRGGYRLGRPTALISVADVRALFARFHRMVTTSPDVEVEDMGKLSVLAGVRQFPVRVKCASLAWHTLKAALDREERTTTE